jgi:hypothetical protein
MRQCSGHTVAVFDGIRPEDRGVLEVRVEADDGQQYLGASGSTQQIGRIYDAYV